MNNTTNYQKVASYEVNSDQIDHVLLLFSGGLDTSMMLKWIQENYKAKVTTLTLDLGQQKDDMEAVKQKALQLGAQEAIIYDAKEEFANILAMGIKANASYQGDYHLSTPLGRVILAKKAVDFAVEKNISVIAHGATGKGNDQVRIEGYILTQNPNLKIIAPVREWNMSRDEQIEFAKQHGIPVPASADFPYSVDDNMWGMTWEGGEIEFPNQANHLEKFLTTYTLPENAPDQAETVVIEFEQGIPTALNGNKLPLSKLIVKLNNLAGKHGVGIVQVIEDRLVGLKNGGVYELPAAHTIITAHKALEQYVCTQELNQLKQQLDVKWAYLTYSAKWYDPAMQALNAFNDFVNSKVSGKVNVKLFKGKATVIAMESDFGLAYTSFNNSEGYNFNVNASPGFIEIYTLQMKIAAQLNS